MGLMQPITLLATACLFFLVINNGFAIRCWICRSESEPNCADPFNNNTISIHDCSQTSPGEMVPNKCKKVKIDGHVNRTCARATENNMPSNCTKAANDKGVMVETCYCDDKDGCNSLDSPNAAIATAPINGMVTLLIVAVTTFAMN